MKRFWDKVTKTDSCWLWTAWCDRDGYGYFYKNGKNFRAHRVSYELQYGTINDNRVIDHLCRNTSCVNPLHLELVEPRVNTIRGNTVNNKKSKLPVGVYITPAGNYVARKRVGGEKVHIGTFKTPTEASVAYMKFNG